MWSSAAWWSARKQWWGSLQFWPQTCTCLQHSQACARGHPCRLDESDTERSDNESSDPSASGKCSESETETESGPDNESSAVVTDDTNGGEDDEEDFDTDEDDGNDIVLIKTKSHPSSGKKANGKAKSSNSKRDPPPPPTSSSDSVSSSSSEKKRNKKRIKITDSSSNSSAPPSTTSYQFSFQPTGIEVDVSDIQALDPGSPRHSSLCQNSSSRKQVSLLAPTNNHRTSYVRRSMIAPERAITAEIIINKDHLPAIVCCSFIYIDRHTPAGFYALIKFTLSSIYKYI
jgi:hypothetical protein